MPSRPLLFLTAALSLAFAGTSVAQKKNQETKEEAPPSAEDARKAAELLKLPNLVLIIADDMAWDDLSRQGMLRS